MFVVLPNSRWYKFMGKYGETAILAAREAAKTQNPVDAWKSAAIATFPNSPASREKGCPKSTFLGLCENGLIVGVESGSFTRSPKNKLYALKAVQFLRQDSGLVNNSKKLWKIAIDGANKVENSQMDVVISLWLEQLIN
jgi:hypothetical protein